MLAALSHRTVSGTTVARQVLAADRTAAVVCPVTFTNGLSWPASPDLPGERIRLSEHLTATPQVALDLRVSVADSGGLYLHADFATDAISETVVRGVLRTAADLLEAMADEATWSRGEPVDIDQSVLTSPDTAPPYRDEIRTMLWRNLFQDPPAGVAIVCGGRRIDYPTLAHMVTDAMSVLRADGVRAGDRVTVEMGKGVEQIVTVLACLLMRAVYIPLDPTAPERRREAIVAAVRPRRRVTEGLTGGREGAPTIRFEPSAADDAQYILFTSGSTGAPKGVVVRRDSVEAMMRSSLDRWRIGADDVLFGVSALHHDMSVVDSLAPFQVGATLVLPTHEQRRDAVAWAEAVAAERVTVWISVPAMMDMLLHCAAAGQLGTLRRAVLGGDWVTGELVDRLRTAAPDCGITSVGGPTETTVWNIWHDVVPQGPGPVPYGSPLPGNAYQVVDDHGRPVPPGVVGRMRCTGIAVADGYLVAGDAVPPGFGTTVGADGLAQRSFLTSDIGRYRPDGVIEFLGRADGFVKVRGVRIEPGEVEKELLSHSAVARAVVSAVRADPADSFGETALGCLYVAANGSDPAELRAHLERRLPSSHVPTVWRRVDDVPLTPNGKPDRDSVEHILRTSVEGADTDPLVWLTAAALNRVRPDDEVPVDAATEIPMHWLARGGLAAVVRQMSELTGGVPVDPAALAGADTVGGVVAALRSGPSASELVAAAELAREIEQLTDDEVDARLG
ncbi:AMP-binding protein [Gordonia humi]|uniref:AMP-binding protein n=1 Tax=Gordonia humi TaxID=686429 RepID=UPI0036086D86